jgi:hypothetical protein
MNKILILLSLLLPATSFGQHFELSAQAGLLSDCKTDQSYAYGEPRGYCGLLNGRWQFAKHLSVNASYEWSQYNYFEHHYAEHVAGIGPEVTTKFFYAGADLKVAQLQQPSTFNYGQIKNELSPGYGIHAGLRQHLCKQLWLKEEGGYEHLDLHYSYFSGYRVDDLSQAPTGGPRASAVAHSDRLYLTAGIAYKF